MAKSDNSAEPTYFGIKKEALRAKQLLEEGMDEYPNFPCRDNPGPYMDYEDYLLEDDEVEIPPRRSSGETFMLCALCPIIDLCYDFAKANDETTGVWGGTDFGHRANRRLGKLF